MRPLPAPGETVQKAFLKNAAPTTVSGVSIDRPRRSPHVTRATSIIASGTVEKDV
jgi:hypothetical protein